MQSKKRKYNEYILVIPSDKLWHAGYFQGFSSCFEKYLYIIQKSGSTVFKLRDDVESDPNYKQIIPYVILRYKNSLFSYRRGKLLQENRLFGQYSIGIGGHITIKDTNWFSETYQEGMERELKEEVHIDSPYSEVIAGVLNDDRNDVGKVHFGLVYIFNLDRPKVKSKEKSINEAQFLPLSKIKKNLEKYENWSQICFQQIENMIDLT